MLLVLFLNLGNIWSHVGLPMDHRKAKKEHGAPSVLYYAHIKSISSDIYIHIYICKEFNDLWQNPCYVRG